MSKEPMSIEEMQWAINAAGEKGSMRRTIGESEVKEINGALDELKEFHQLRALWNEVARRKKRKDDNETKTDSA